MTEKLLIANRGEIACRIIQSCARIGIKTVAVYSEADHGARHVEMADEAVLIGNAKLQESYLNADVIVKAARERGACLLHPGYGFLAESPKFAKAVEDAGITWVGPSAAVIEAMGDKERARQIAKQAGVPILPGSGRLDSASNDSVALAAQEVGFPLLVKAVAGGGGIGMQLVRQPQDLLSVMKSAQSMAAKAFGDAGVYLERFIPNARHVEVQIFGYGDGTAVHLHDRECSIQRRFQKIIEEAPAPNIPDAVRTNLQSSAIALAGIQRYSGAGTVEFIYDCDRKTAYFLEMNTRIQVEHPVTEMITGVDIVAWQILHALGRLGQTLQDRIRVEGHAIECRLYAEQPERNFLPSPGLVTALKWPDENSDLRVDTGIRTGDRITPFYDPLIAKIIARGINREQTIEALAQALKQINIEGLRTNVAFLRDVLTDHRFNFGIVTTDFVEKFHKERLEKASRPYAAP
ncbi:ATP-grasp domain-containing protein [Alcaligenaceae bacterium]|nr:ATP-grasp domain-containing protein [Alcaligenaceae bacterium]